MTVRATGTGSPLNRRTLAALKRAEALAAKLMEEDGRLSKRTAMERAYAQLRAANSKHDWRHRKAKKAAKK
jgi:hypothetical protein